MVRGNTGQISLEASLANVKFNDEIELKNLVEHKDAKPEGKAFHAMQQFEPTKFNSSYVESNCLSSFFYTYALDIVSNVNKNGGVFELSDTMDAND